MSAKSVKRSEHLDRFGFSARRQRHTRSTPFSTIARKCVHKRVLRLRAPLSCTGLFHDHGDEIDAFHESVCFVKNCVRSVWVLAGGVPLAIACETNSLPIFLYSCTAGCRYINRGAKFDGHASSSIAANSHTDPSGKGGTP